MKRKIHYHKTFDRKIMDCQKNVICSNVKVEVIFYDKLKKKFLAESLNKMIYKYN